MVNIGNKIRPGYRCTNYELNSLPFIGHWKFTFFDFGIRSRQTRSTGGEPLNERPETYFAQLTKADFFSLELPVTPPSTFLGSEQLRQNSYYKSQDSRIVIRFLLCPSSILTSRRVTQDRDERNTEDLLETVYLSPPIDFSYVAVAFPDNNGGVCESLKHFADFF